MLKVHKKYRWMLSVLLACLPTMADYCQAAPEHSSTTSGQVASVLQPVVGKLKNSKVPVLVPSWLPSAKVLTTAGKVYPRSSVEAGNYSISLSGRPGNAPGAATCFFMSGDTEPCEKTGKKVDLGNGHTGYIELGNLMSVAWVDGKYCYRLGLAAEEKDLIKAAKSVIRVF